MLIDAMMQLVAVIKSQTLFASEMPDMELMCD
jgi:hypothetical protein